MPTAGTYSKYTCQPAASTAKKLFSAALDGIGKEPKLLVFDGRDVVSEEPSQARNMQEAVATALGRLQNGESGKPMLRNLAFAGVRVVHGGLKYPAAVRANSEVRSDIESLQDLAPLHNQNSLTILEVLDKPRAVESAAAEIARERRQPASSE